MKILAIDIETAPALTYTFNLYKPVIPIDFIVEPPRIICFSYQWDGQKKVGFVSEYHDNQEFMLQELRRLLDEADVILTYNGKKFDQPWINGELFMAGLQQPSPYDHIDLYQFVRTKMRLISNKLDYVSMRLLGERKVSHAGASLWRGCLSGDEKSWATMRKYSIQDTKLMLPLYHKMKGWFTTGHPNRAVIDGQPSGCIICASTNIQKRGLRHSNVGTYQRYQCADCGRWMKGKTMLSSTEFRPA